MPADFADPNAFPQEEGPCGPPVDRPILAHSNCMGRGAVETTPELGAVLTPDPLACLDYVDIRRNDGAAQELRDLIGAYEGVDPDQVILGGSGLDWFATLAGSLGCRTIIRVEGDFFGYDRPTVLHDLERVLVPIDPATRMLDPTVLAETVTGRKNAMLCMTFPATNPLQTPITRQHLKAVIAANPDITILLDGAYRQFGDHQQLATLALQYPQVIYMQVASKDLHLPGARLSWVVPSKRHAARLMASAAPYPLNSGAVGQVMAMLRRHDLIAELHEQQRLARDHLAKALGRVGLPILRGAGPWVLLKWPTDAATLVRDLERRFAILVQQQTMPPLDNSWIRISATVPHEARRITSAISALIGEKLAV